MVFRRYQIADTNGPQSANDSISMFGFPEAVGSLMLLASFNQGTKKAEPQRALPLSSCIRIYSVVSSGQFSLVWYRLPMY